MSCALLFVLIWGEICYDLYDLDGLSPEGDPCLSLYSLEEEGYK